jgi:hypothetical protein
MPKEVEEEIETPFEALNIGISEKSLTLVLYFHVSRISFTSLSHIIICLILFYSIADV